MGNEVETLAPLYMLAVDLVALSRTAHGLKLQRYPNRKSIRTCGLRDTSLWAEGRDNNWVYFTLIWPIWRGDLGESGKIAKPGNVIAHRATPGEDPLE